LQYYKVFQLNVFDMLLRSHLQLHSSSRLQFCDEPGRSLYSPLALLQGAIDGGHEGGAGKGVRLPTASHHVKELYYGISIESKERKKP
jgi:hypothetical protein